MIPDAIKDQVKAVTNDIRSYKGDFGGFAGSMEQMDRWTARTSQDNVRRLIQATVDMSADITNAIADELDAAAKGDVEAEKHLARFYRIGVKRALLVQKVRSRMDAAKWADLCSYASNVHRPETDKRVTLLRALAAEVDSGKAKVRPQEYIDLYKAVYKAYQASGRFDLNSLLSALREGYPTAAELALARRIAGGEVIKGLTCPTDEEREDEERNDLAHAVSMHRNADRFESLIRAIRAGRATDAQIGLARKLAAEANDPEFRPARGYRRGVRDPHMFG